MIKCELTKAEILKRIEDEHTRLLYNAEHAQELREEYIRKAEALEDLIKLLEA